jgi:hypothetical protein
MVFLKMRVAGRCLALRRHSHGAAFNRSFFFAATARDLGLSLLRTAQNGWGPVTLAEANFSDFESLGSYVLQNLKDSRTRACKQKDAGCRNSPRPILIAQFNGLQEKVNGWLYDRYVHAVPNDCSWWSFQQNDITTSLFFNHVIDEKSLAMTLVRNRSSTISQFAQHMSHFVYFVADDNSSSYLAYQGSHSIRRDY